MTHYRAAHLNDEISDMFSARIEGRADELFRLVQDVTRAQAELSYAQIAPNAEEFDRVANQRKRNLDRAIYELNQFIGECNS